MPPTRQRIAAVWGRSAKTLRPPPKVPLSTWLEATIRLPHGLAADGGPLRLWPTQRGIADALTDESLERVTLLKSARSGFTTLLTGLIAHHCSNDPAAVLCVLPTEADCRDYIASDIEPIFEASPSLRGVLGEPGRSKVGRNLITHRMFEGGSLKIVAAKAPRNLRRHSARILLVDEADAAEISAEGNPIALAEKRTLSFSNRKIIVGSTPLEEDTSHVLRLWAQSDQRIFETPCPSCGAFTEIRWAHIEWQDGKPDTAAFRCPHCEDLIGESSKRDMVEAGQWTITKPDVQGHAGFRLNALVSLLPNASWAKLAAEFLQAKNDPDELRVFVNTVLAEGWRDQGDDDVDDTALAARAEDFDLEKIPAEVLAITVGADLADDRIEASIVGHAKDGTAFVLDHVILYGSPADQRDEVWREFDELLRTRWKHPHGGSLRVDAACVDAGDGDHYDAVLAFCTSRLRNRVFAVKGVYGPGRPAIARSRSKTRALFIMGSDTLKGQIITRLAKGRTIRFGRTLDENYYLQLCSERRIVRMSRGRPVIRFERRPGMLAEALDALAMALAAKAALRLDLDQRETELASPIPAGSLSERPPIVRRSSFMERGRV